MPSIHPSAVVATGAEIAEGVEVGPYCTIGEHVSIGVGSRIGPHANIDGYTSLGAECQVFPFASLGTKTQDLKFDGGITRVEIGDRTVIREYVTVNAATSDGDVTRVGSGCLLMAYTHIAHDCDIGDGVIMSNNSQLAGHVVVEEDAIIGGMCGVHQFVRFGRGCMVGGFSRITQDVPPYMLAEGNPLVVRGINSIGLKRRQVNPEQRSALKKAFQLLYRSNLSLKDAAQQIEETLGDDEMVQHVATFVKASERGISR
jgi:UDP-N-acetylglucosamine acyltransferase